MSNMILIKRTWGVCAATVMYNGCISSQASSRSCSFMRVRVSSCRRSQEYLAKTEIAQVAKVAVENTHRYQKRNAMMPGSSMYTSFLTQRLSRVCVAG